MSTFELEILANAADRQAQPKLSLFDYVTRLVLPGLSLLAVIFKKDIQPPIFWSLLTFMVISFAAGFYHPIAASIRNWSERGEDRRTARAAFPKLRSFAHRFEKFIGGYSDTLHYIAQCDVCQGGGQRYHALGLPDLSVWHAFWKDFTDRLDRMNVKHANILELRYAMMAFFDLVGTYDNQCVSALFDRLPQSERDALTPQAKSSLNSFHIRFTHFLKEYENFAMEVCETRPALNGVHFSFSMPKPIS
jgi:hypothetical protein